MKKLSLLFLATLLLLGIVAGCSKDDKATENTAAKSTEQQATKSDKEEQTTDTAWPRTITDAADNEITLEAKPTKVAVLHPLYMDYLFALEETPYASTSAAESLEDYETLAPFKEEEVIDLGSGREANLEMIAQAQPDIIIAFKGQVDKNYDSLVKIAPVIQIDYTDTWQNTTRFIAALVGKESLADEYIAETEELVNETRTKLGDKMDKTFAVLRADGKDFIAQGSKNAVYYKEDSFGLKAPELYPEEAEALSLEGLGEMNPDYIIVQHDEKVAEATIANVASLQTWQSLDAVKNNHVYIYNGSLNSASILAVRVIAQKLMDIED